MTPEEKAKELIEKYVNEPISFPYIDTEDGQCIGSGYMILNSAKQCAIILCDEILEDMTIRLGLDKSDFEYWEQVKQEIEKL